MSDAPPWVSEAVNPPQMAPAIVVLILVQRSAGKQYPKKSKQNKVAKWGTNKKTGWIFQPTNSKIQEKLNGAR